MAIKRELSLQERFELLDEVHTALIRGVEITIGDATVCTHNSMMEFFIGGRI